MLEVLVAMTIVGLGVVTLLQIFSLGLRLQARSTVRTEAVLQGARVMDELLARKRLGEGSDEANSPLTDVGARKFRRCAMHRPRSVCPAIGSSRKLLLEMVVLDGESERRMELKTLRLAKKVNP